MNETISSHTKACESLTSFVRINTVIGIDGNILEDAVKTTTLKFPLFKLPFSKSFLKNTLPYSAKTSRPPQRCPPFSVTRAVIYYNPHFLSISSELFFKIFFENLRLNRLRVSGFPALVLRFRRCFSCTPSEREDEYTEVPKNCQQGFQKSFNFFNGQPPSGEKAEKGFPRGNGPVTLPGRDGSGYGRPTPGGPEVAG